MNISPISSKRIYQNIIEQFIDMIKEGKLYIGQKLPPESQLAKMFNVSRASVREAFSAMEIIGLVEVRPGGGSYVTDINIIPFINTIAPLFLKNGAMEMELLEFRKMLELEAAKLAAKKSLTADLGKISEAVDMMKVALENDDPNLGTESDILFHRELFRLTGNYVMIKASECIAYILENSVRFNRQLVLKDKEYIRIFYDKHFLIYEAIKLGDEMLAVVRMNEHLDVVHEILMNAELKASLK